MKASEQSAFGIVVVTVLVGFVVIGAGYLPQARLAPVTIGVPTLGLMLAQMWQVWASRRKPARDAAVPCDGGSGPDGTCPPGATEGDTESAGRVALGMELSIIGWISGFAALIWLVGFTVAIPVFLFLMVRTKFRESLAVSANLALAVWAALYIAFDVLLKVRMNCGILFRIWA
ncbi:MAG: tripartite tricarboxylate transporter TctB family protein [Bacillota bacterium]